MTALRAVLLLTAALGTSCMLRQASTERLFVTGKAYLCSEAYARGKFAVGKTVRMMAGEQVLAEDVVGPDGSFVLHPRVDQPVEGRVYLVAEGRQLTLGNDYAAWLQNHIHYRAEVQFPCEPAQPPAAPAPDPKVVDESAPRIPPTQLVPQHPL